MKNIYIVLTVVLITVVMLISGCAAPAEEVTPTEEVTPAEEITPAEEVTPTEEVAQAKNGEVVKVHYTGKTDDGTVFDSSFGHEPLQFTIGEGKLLFRFEQSVIGMKPGESKTIEIPAHEAYGPYREDLVMFIDWSQLSEGVKPEVGQQLKSTQPDGRMIVATVIEVSESGITIDANHPLAKEDLIFDIELIEIV
ncbi:MAG: peptidylprolyl isomerase [Chloroflexota bacterium]|nr:peptidylprolyl isomerase [Chloroflexota bacterium]